MSEKVRYLDDKARMIVEKNTDALLKNPKISEKMYKNALSRQGIEPTLETCLSFLVGWFTGMINAYYILTSNRNLNSNEHNELSDLLKRRATEIRMAFLETRIQE